MLHENPKIWGVTSIGERGQLVIPAKLREEFGIKKGYEFVVVTKKSGKVIMLMPEKEMTKMLKGAIEKIENLKEEGK
jgi:AbrB family looped-hinge helix DNA binding protein